MADRTGEVTFKGNPITLTGPKLEAGQTAPDFSLLDNSLSKVTLKDTTGKVRIISVVPSLDTGVCDQQTRHFNQDAQTLGDAVQIYCVSADLPFAQVRWCGAAEANNIQALSDHFDMNFGNAWGTHIKELRLDSRAVFVLDANDTIVHAEYVKEVTQHPDYDAALNAAKKLI